MYYYLVPSFLFASVCLVFSQLRMAKVGFILSVPFLILIASLRGDVGVDTHSYLVNVGNIISKEGYFFVFEPGFVLLVLFFGSLGMEPRSILIAISLFLLFFLSPRYYQN